MPDPSATRTPAKGAFSDRLIPMILAIALFMEQMDSTVISTSLPAIATDIGTNPIALKLALTAYLVSLAIFIPISGWMATRFGPRRVFATAIGVFVIGSVMCAMSWSLGSFVVSRFLQGMGGAMMTPVARLLLVRATPKSELVSAMAWLTIPALIGPMLGPPVGGFITTYFSWHWIFLINVPIGVIGVWLALTRLPDLPPDDPGKLDRTGFVLTSLAAAGIVFGLSVISLPALPPVVGVVTTIAGFVFALLYMRHARRTEKPVLDFSLLRNAAFRASVLGGSLFRVGSGALPFLLPLMFQLGFGMNPFQSGLLTFVSAAGALAMKFMVPATLRIAGFRNVMIVSALIASAFIAVAAAFTPETPVPVILAVLFSAGLMRSLFFTGVNSLVFAELDEKQIAPATALAAATQQLSIALGVAIAGGILELFAILTGQTLGLASFSWAFLIVAAISASAALPFIWLHPDAGNAVSGKAPVARGTSPIQQAG